MATQVRGTLHSPYDSERTRGGCSACFMQGEVDPRKKAATADATKALHAARCDYVYQKQVTRIINFQGVLQACMAGNQVPPGYIEYRVNERLPGQAGSLRNAFPGYGEEAPWS